MGRITRGAKNAWERRGEDLTDDQREAFEERASILEFDGGMSRAEAEKVAARQMMLTPEDLIEFEMGQSDGSV